MFLDPISQSALQVYYTGIPFTPSSALVRKTFQRELGGTMAILSGQWDGWDASIRAISMKSSIQSIAFSPDGKLLASGNDTEGVQLWNAITGINVANLGPKEKPSCAVRFSPSGAYVAVGCGNGLVTMWDTLTGQTVIDDDEQHDKPVKSLVFSHNSAILASASQDNYIQLWDVSQGHFLRRLTLEGTVLHFAFSSNNRLLVSGCEDTTIIIWNLESATLHRKLKGHSAAVNCVAVSDDNTLLASGSDDKTVRVWDTRTGVCLRTYPGHDNPIRAVRLAPDNGHVISISKKVVAYSKISKKKSFECIWSAGQFFRNTIIHMPVWYSQIARFMTSRFVGQMVSTDEDDSTIVSDFSPGFDFTFSYNGAIFLATSLKPLSPQPPLFGSLNDDSFTLALSSDTTRIATGSTRGILQMWDPALPMWNWKDFAGLMKETLEVLVPSPDGRFCLARTLFQVALMSANGKIIKSLEGGFIATSDLIDDKKTNMAFSPDSNMFAYWSDEFRSLYTAGSIRIYDSATGKRISRCSGIANIECVTFSPDGARIACGNEEGILKIWDVSSSNEILTIAPPSPFVLSSIRFSPDGLKIVGGTSEGHVQLWDASNGQSIADLDGHGSKVKSFVFTLDSSRIIYYHEDNSIHVWSPPSAFAHSLTSSAANIDTVEMLVYSDTDSTITCRSTNGSISVWTLPKDIKSVCANELDKGSFCEMCSHQPDSQSANPHLISQSEPGNIYDNLLRSAYVFREDGWIYHGTQRLFWLPSTFRPASPSAMVAYRQKLWILTATERILLLDISAIDYRLKRDSQLVKPEFLTGKFQQ
ncbi:WD40-repeat-containing domain protein [Hygrophoropsis aurantiaca]|uniref:WD40-repeat-containing domain protein n=1 Tax=Hygrophoropsis aurantiaca TaxID=72124 RepID=A0ACB8ATH2_9AGAM|nr:WD40-repeat-containing domain protein [Hygrophoropsis aurantiaca]